MIALGALKVVVVALAVTVAALATLMVGLMSLDGDERRRGAVDGRWLVGRHPSLIVFVTILISAGLTCVFALLVATIAWAVGA